MTEETEKIMCYTLVPDRQIMTYTLTPDNGALTKAKTVGASISHIAKILYACRDPDDGNTEIFITGLSMTEDGGVSVKFGILPFFGTDGEETGDE